MTTVEQIHNEIDTAQDRLLAQARQIIATIEPNTEYAERMKKAGFVGSEIVAKMKPLIVSKEQAELIEYYKQKYPFQKFLTEKEFDRICDKYNLIYAPIVAYKKNVPEKNLRDVENMRPVDQFDEAKNIERCELEYYKMSNGGNTFLSPNSKWRKILPKTIDRHLLGRSYANQYLNDIYRTGITYLVQSINNITITRSGLFIAAPKSHFNLDGLKISGKGFFNFVRIEPKDPIVYRYVRGGIQVITKWGIESNDEGLVNETMN